MRVAIDTNVLVSGMLWDGYPAMVIQAARDGLVQPVVTGTLLQELAATLKAPQIIPRVAMRRTSVAEIVETVRQLCEIVVAVEVPGDAVRDPDDLAVLSCALGGQADIATGDKDLLVLREFEGIAIMTPLDCLRTMGLA